MAEHPSDPKNHKRKTNLFSRVMRMFESTFPFLQNNQKSDVLLIGRIREIQQTADSVLNELQEIKSDLKKELDGELYVFVEGVINPLIREIGRIEKQMNINQEPSETSDIFKRYSEWILKAKLWVQVAASKHDKETIAKFVVRQSIKDFVDLIDRDLRLIKDYEEQSFGAITIDEENEQVLKKRLHTILVPYLNSLKALKHTPVDLSLKELIIWKGSVDKRRDRYYNSILQVIDNIVADISPPSRVGETQEHLIDILEQIERLEQNVPELLANVKKKANLLERHILISQLISAEEEIDNLYLDMRLPTEIADRLQVLKNQLKKGLQEFPQ